MAVDATLYVRRDGAMWTEAHGIEFVDLEMLDLSEPYVPRQRIVEIKDGEGVPPPLMFYVVPNRPREDDGVAMIGGGYV